MDSDQDSYNSERKSIYHSEKYRKENGEQRCRNITKQRGHRRNLEIYRKNNGLRIQQRRLHMNSGSARAFQ